MQTPVEVAFRHYEPSDQVRAEIVAQARRLEKFSARITSCHIVVTGPQNRRRNGDVFDVELRIAMPNHKDIIVDNCRDNAPEREHALVAIRQAFNAARRQIEDAERDMRGEVKIHAPETPQARGRVKKLMPVGEYGFIEADDGREIYFHRKAVANKAFGRLNVGDEVRFVEDEGLRGQQAKSVEMLNHRPA